jgi:hypothetical protein
MPVPTAITKAQFARTPEWSYSYPYLIVDIYSRHGISTMVTDRESEALR